MSSSTTTTSSRRNHRRNDNSNISPSAMTSTIILALVAMTGFFLGTLFTMHAGLGHCDNNNNNNSNNNNDNTNDINNLKGSNNDKIEQMAQKRFLELKATLPKCQSDTTTSTGKDNVKPSNSVITFPKTMDKYMVGMARTSKLDFMKLLDTGVPIDLPKADQGDADVLLLYSRTQALPDHFDDLHHASATTSHEVGKKSSIFGGLSSTSSTTSTSPDLIIPPLDTAHALEHCDFVNIILTDHSKQRNQCLAIVPQYESYHIQKWMRLRDPTSSTNKNNNNNKNTKGVDSTAPLQFVSRGMQPNGQDQGSPPKTQHIQQNWDMLRQYFNNYQDVLNELKPIVEKVATKDTKIVTVMVSNFGQSELLVNFVCAATSRNLDLSSILVFATDLETKALAESLGLTAFYDRRNFGEMPKEAAKHYGDQKFVAMMMAKVICVQVVNALKYHVLFQDVDIVWYKNPITFFEKFVIEKDKSISTVTNHKDNNNDEDDDEERDYSQFDMLFQDDGGHTTRYAPYSANSGFYFVKYNARTEYFFSSLLLSGDLILKTDSHQQALIALLNDHASLYGLKIKVFSRDEYDFPGGYQYHQASGAYMKKLLIQKSISPYLFHMSWTLNKDNKLLYLRQMGEWYVKDPCVHFTVSEIASNSTTSISATSINDSDGTISSTIFLPTCCSVEPLISCHYRDKPSIIPCKDSPPIDAGKPSWWK